MKNWIICPVHNSLDLTITAYNSFMLQDIDVQVLLVLNDPTPQIISWANKLHDVPIIRLTSPTSVARAWNMGLDWVFDAENADYVLVVNNDVELLPETYRTLIETGEEFVTCVSVNERSQFIYNEIRERRPHPDFSCFLIRNEVYKKVGRFDEEFKIAYCEDNDYHCRMHQAGIQSYCIGLPFLHHGASTIKSVGDEKRSAIQLQADLNREYFFNKWKFRVGSVEYYDFFGGFKQPQ